MRHSHHKEKDDPHTVEKMEKPAVRQHCGYPQQQNTHKIPQSSFLKSYPGFPEEKYGKPE